VVKIQEKYRIVKKWESPLLEFIDFLETSSWKISIALLRTYNKPGLVKTLKK